MRLHKLVKVNPPDEEQKEPHRWSVALGFQDGEGKGVSYAAVAIVFDGKANANAFYIGMLKLMDKTVVWAEPPEGLVTPESPA